MKGCKAMGGIVRIRGDAVEGKNWTFRLLGGIRKEDTCCSVWRGSKSQARMIPKEGN